MHLLKMQDYLSPLHAPPPNWAIFPSSSLKSRFILNIVISMCQASTATVGAFLLAYPVTGEIHG